MLRQKLMGGAGVEPAYIEDIFSTWLYTGNGTTQTIANGIDLAGEGGLVWLKGRSGGSSHHLTDTQRGTGSVVYTNLTNAAASVSDVVTAFNADGFGIGANSGINNAGGTTYASWTFRKQPKFFDVVTWVGDGNYPRTITHNLGSAPGCIITKNTSNPLDWFTYHRSLGNNQALRLNTTGVPFDAGTNMWNATSTSFTLTTNLASNNLGSTYVAYLFAHNAGGFGLTGTDNVISCGSFLTSSGNASVTLGYEPQWLLIKKTSGTAENWFLFDTMRNNSQTGSQYVFPNTSNAELTQSFGFFVPNATGFSFNNNSLSTADTYVYVAIRRGPMKVPTTGTSVFQAGVYTGDSDKEVVNTGANSISDFVLMKPRTSTSFNDYIAQTMLTNRMLKTNLTDNEVNGVFDNYLSTGFTIGNSQRVNASGVPYVYQAFRRAPGFFDEVCYTGTGSARTVAHNLAAVPELMIVKSRSSALGWFVYAAPIGNTQYLVLNATDASATLGFWNNTTPTASVFSVGAFSGVNNGGATYVAYLFASAPGVSKVFSYTGNGSSQTINCGFTGGARLVIVKRTDSTGDWYVWDTARGIVAGNDPHLSLNTTAAEVTTDDTIDTDSTGFVVNQVAATNVNVNAATYIGLAIS